MLSKFKHILAGALLVLPLALQIFAGLQSVNAAETPAIADTTTVELTKLVFPDGTDVHFDNNGLQADTQGGKPVAGVQFQAYNITAKFTDVMANAKPEQGQTKQEAAVAAIQKQATDTGDGTAFGSAVGDAVITNQAGVADFTLANQDGQGNYQTYLILETQYADPEVNGNNTIVKRSTPLVLTMPLNTAKSGDKAYLYPKNYDQPAIKKDLSDKTNSAHEVGEQIGYTITTPIPFDIASRANYVVTDTPDLGLDDLKTPLKVQANGKDVPAAAYTVSNNQVNGKGLGFALTFTPSALGAFAGQTLTVSYTAQITSDAVTNSMQNSADVTFGHTPHTTTSVRPLTVGGAKFIKKDADSEKPLADAVFVLENGSGQIITKTKDAAGRALYKPIDATKLDVQKLNAAVEDKHGDDKKAAVVAELVNQLGPDAQNAVVAISSDDGTFEFTGLKYAQYRTVELAAPQGYAVLTKACDFTASAHSYTTPLTITNTTKGILPHTGGMGIYLVIALGLIVMIGGYIGLKKGNHHEEV